MHSPLLYQTNLYRIHNYDGRTIIEYMAQLSPSARYVLEALIPYSEANLRLAFKPASFFQILEKKSKTKQRTLRSAYYRAVQKGLLTIDDTGIPRLTAKGRHKIKPYNPVSLARNSCLLVVFDILETERAKRNHLRALLRELSFKKVQQSVWVSQYDHREYLAMELKEYDLLASVLVYEALKLPLK